MCSRNLSLDAQSFECEDGSGKFVSVGAVNHAIGVLLRTIDDEEYRKFLISKLDER